MKFSNAIPLLMAAASPALAHSTRTTEHNAIAARQAHVPRGLVDVCVGLDVDLDLLEILGTPLIVGHLDVCLCLSLLPDFVQSNSVCQSASKQVGQVKTQSLLESLINNSTAKQQCTFPDHAKSICSASAPCNFSCEDGYEATYADGQSASNSSAVPTGCGCPSGKTECNGQCGDFPNGCGSSTATTRRRRSNTPVCSNGMTVCGVTGGKRTGWECVDTASDLESCGGCAIASPFDTPSTLGVDCSAIPNVATVSCQSSKCLVEQCVEGFSVSSTSDSCVPISARDLVGADVVEGLVANVGGLVGLKEGAVGDVHVGRDLLDAGLIEGATADVAGLVGVSEGAVASAHVARDLVGADVVEGLVANVGGLVGLKEGAVGDVHVGRDLLDAGLIEGATADVAGLVGVSEGAVASAHVARDLLDAGLVEGLTADVAGLVGVSEGAAASAHVARDLLNAGLVEGLTADVGGLVGLTEGAAAGVHVA